MDCPIDINKIQSEVLLFTLENCPKCIETKANLRNFEVKFQEVNLEFCRLANFGDTINLIEVATTIIIKSDKNVKIII